MGPSGVKGTGRLIEDHGLIGDCRTAALVANDGTIDWLCFPRFDSPACFAALLGGPDNGFWRIAPVAPVTRVSRRYRPETLVLETLFETTDGRVVLLDFMVPGGDGRDGNYVVRVIEGRGGTIPMRLTLVPRFAYGSAIPLIRRLDDGGIYAVAGPDQLVLRGPGVEVGPDASIVAAFIVASGSPPCDATGGASADGSGGASGDASGRTSDGAPDCAPDGTPGGASGARIAFVLNHAPSHHPVPPSPNADAALAEVARFWRDWAKKCTYRGPWRDQVLRSLLTLKALTYEPTGGMIAAPTTSLPERLGGERNWDYRYCWLRDSSLALTALMRAGFGAEARAWTAWLHRSLGGAVAQMQPLYGVAGERHIAEWEVPWLAGYLGSKPVRIGNAASTQCQLDIFGSVMDALHLAAQSGVIDPRDHWDMVVALVTHLETVWHLPDEGIWEVRGGARHFTYSKAMVWVAFDRAIRIAEAHGLPAPLQLWRGLRSAAHAMVCADGFNPIRNSFTQSFSDDVLDASLLLLPAVGFLPADDPRIVGTCEAIGWDLMEGGLIRRYRTEDAGDGLSGTEGSFLACSFWYVDALILQGRLNEASAMFERLLALSNDVGLLAEEYDPLARRQLGNFPQGFSHLALVNTALNLEAATTKDAAQL